MVVVNDLGPVCLDGIPIEDVVGSPTQRLLLAALAVEHPNAATGDRLTELLWPGEAPGKRRLWDNVHRLRRALDVGDIGIDVVRLGDGYALDRSVSLDSQRFDELVGRAEAAQEAAPSEAITLLSEASNLWRGTPLAGYDLEGFAPGVTVKLEELRLRAVLALARARLAVDDPGTAIGELEDLVVHHPFDEDLILLLVTAMHRSGRRVDALRRLRGFQQNLAEQVGLDAGERLANLEAELLSATTAAESFSQAPTPAAELPRWRTSFIGRERVAIQLKSLVGGNRLVTIVGPGGVGKTRLATEALRGNDGADSGVCFVDLAVTSEPSRVDAVVAAALGIRDASPRDSLTGLLSRSRSVLIFDNCEHVPAAASDLIDHLLDRTSGTSVVATSRVPLRLGGEMVLRLEPLDLEIGSGLSVAGRLFCDRAGLVVDQLSTDDERLIEDIARRLDGLPLAVELAAARASSMSLADLRSGLDDRYDLLTSGDRTAPDRHRTLQAAVDWSYDQLGPDQQAALIRSSTFAGRFTLDDAASICASPSLTPSRVRSAVADLVDASLVVRGQDAPPYRLLETLRQYGGAELAATGEQAAWVQRHAAHFTTRACQLADISYGPDERRVIDDLLAQSDEYRAAIQSLRVAQDWDRLPELIYGLTAIAFSMRGTWPEPVLLVADLALEPPDPVPPRWPVLLSVVAANRFNRGLFDEAERHASLAIRLSPDWFRSWVSGSGVAAYRTPGLAVERGEEALKRSDPDKPDEVLASLTALSIAKRIAGDQQGALEDAHRLVDESRRFQTQRGESIGLVQVARALPNGAPGAADQARRAFELATASRTGAAEVGGAMLHIRHLLAEDLDVAAAALADYLRLPIHSSPHALRILAAAAAYFAMIGDIDIARRLGNLVGRPTVREFAGYPAVDTLLEQIPAHVDPMDIPPREMETTTAIALDRLLS